MRDIISHQFVFFSILLLIYGNSFIYSDGKSFHFFLLCVNSLKGQVISESLFKLIYEMAASYKWMLMCEFFFLYTFSKWIESQHISQIALIWYRLIKSSRKQIAYDSHNYRVHFDTLLDSIRLDWIVLDCMWKYEWHIWKFQSSYKITKAKMQAYYIHTILLSRTDEISNFEKSE